LSTLIRGFSVEEKIVGVICYNKFPTAGKVIFVTKDGMAKATEIAEYNTRTKKVVACGLKSGDEIVSANLLKRGENILMLTKDGMSLCTRQSQINSMGRSAKGVKAMTLSPDDEIIYAQPLDAEGEVLIVTNAGYAKRVLAFDYIPQNRGGKGTKTMNFMANGSNGRSIVGATYIKQPKNIIFTLKNQEIVRMNSDEVAIQTPISRGKPYVTVVMGNDIVNCYAHKDNI
jgi:DNA gyrase subunit A